MISQKLSQKMTQKLSPQQIQLMKLLQIPTATLDQRIKEEMEANPALEEGINRTEEEEEARDREEMDNEEAAADEEQFELDDYLQDYLDDDPVNYKPRSQSSSTEEDNKPIPIAVETTFHDYLDEQLNMLDVADEREQAVVEQVVGSIDSDGYLRRETRSIVDDLMFSQNINTTEEEVKKMLKMVQEFDPPGVGARNLQECLALQLKRRLRNPAIQKNADHSAVVQKALEIIESHFEEFSKKHYSKLTRKLSISEDELKDVIVEIIKLNPKPASGYATSPNRNPYYIVPDFNIRNREGELELTLNTRNAPDLCINDRYREMLNSYRSVKSERKPSKQEKEAVMFIKQKIDSAKWFIDAIRQRQDTMYKTMYAILQYQYRFFLSGDEKDLKPMILKDIADITGLDISTVSRVANSKFVQTEFGVKRLKSFFSESIQTEDGEEVSTFEVKNILTEIISKENKRKPMSDEKLKNALQERGYQIARRTVAKYREQLNIPVARLRKEL